MNANRHTSVCLDTSLSDYVELLLKIFISKRRNVKFSVNFWDFGPLFLKLG